MWSLQVYLEHGNGVDLMHVGLQWTDYLALVGDASDNLPGVKGIGEKGAKDLLQTFGTMDNLLSNTDEVGLTIQLMCCISPCRKL